MAEVANVEDGEDELDVRVVANAIGEGVSASLALARLVAGTEAAVEDSMESW